MLVYWAMFAVPAMSTLLLGTRRRLQAAGHLAPGILLILIAFTLLVGLRYQIGTDWFNYKRTIDDLYYANFSGALSSKDAGFGVLVWVANRLGSGMYITNFVCAAVMMYGIARFAHRQPDPWMALTAAVPYLIIVVGMGYTRQAAAIGLLLLALLAFERGNLLRTCVYLVVAALFHGSSLLVLPLFILVIVRRNPQLTLPLGALSVLLVTVLLSRRIDNLYGLYVARENAIDSSGAAIRIFMNVVPSVLFLAIRRRFGLDRDLQLLWTLFAAGSVALLLILPVFPSSTAIDRAALYLIPVQLFVFGRLPLVLGQTPQGARFVSFGSVIYYSAALFVWLNFASNARNWLPYKIVLFS